MAFAPLSASFDTSHLHDDFWVIAVLNNPERFKKRTVLFHEFINRMKNYNANLCVVEVAYGERAFETDDIDVPIKVQLRTDSILWHKENMINIGISRLPSSWKYVAWIDADIDFVRPDWISETIHELQHFPVVQMFEDAVDLGPDHQIISTAKGFVACYKNGLPFTLNNGRKNRGGDKSDTLNANNTSSWEDYQYYDSAYTQKSITWHPGYAWAATREAINTMGGLLDVGICGAGDHHMACSLIGKAEQCIPTSVTHGYRNAVLQWAERASRLHKQVGFIKGTIYHFWHGKKRDRRYGDRWRILTLNEYDPVTHIHKDWQGLLVLYPGHDVLRNDIHNYFKARNEDSIDV